MKCSSVLHNGLPDMTMRHEHNSTILFPTSNRSFLAFVSELALCPPRPPSLLPPGNNPILPVDLPVHLLQLGQELPALQPVNVLLPDTVRNQLGDYLRVRDQTPHRNHPFDVFRGQDVEGWLLGNLGQAGMDGSGMGVGLIKRLAAGGAESDAGEDDFHEVDVVGWGTSAARSAAP